MYNQNDIEDYRNKITKEQAQELVKHSNKFDVYPEICAWYDNKTDFYQDWIHDNKIYKTEKEADQRYDEGIKVGEFKKFKNGEIVRLVI